MTPNENAIDRSGCPADDLLVAAVMGELTCDAGAALAMHTDTCPACRARVAECRRIVDGLQSAGEEDAFPDLVDRVLAQLPPDAWTTRAPAPVSAARPVWGFMFRLAAGLLLAAGLGTLAWYRFGTPVGGADEQTQAVGAGLEWLAARQQVSGGWDVGGLGGQAQYATALQGLAVLALARHSEVSGDQAEALARALDYLAAQQAADGRLGPEVEGTMYNHGIATLALLEGYRMTRRESLRPSIVRALAFIRDAQGTGGGWGYRREDTALPNTSISGWQLQALLLGSRLGWSECDVPLRRGLAWLTGVMDGNGVFGYEQRGQAPAGTDTLTAMGAYCALSAQRAGIRLDDRALASVRVSLAAMAQHAVKDYYHAYFQAGALQVADDTAGRRALGGLRQSVLAAQTRDGADRGGWSAGDRWGPVGGRLYSTSMAMLSLVPDRSAGGPSL